MNDDQDRIKKSLDKLENYIISECYKGYDPFDVLTSPLFRLPILNSSKIIRLGAQQVFRRLNINLRRLLFIEKGLNPVSLGLMIQGFSYMTKVCKEKADYYKEQINFLIEELIKLQSKNYHGSCWGYNFDWEALHAKIPAYSPTIVATGIITNSLFEYYKSSSDNKALDLCNSAVNFLLKDMKKSVEDGLFCYTYSPHDKRQVFNATMKGARLLAQVYSICKDERLINEAKNTVAFVIKYQNDDGSWYYSKNEKRNWIDNFHTAYVLNCLHQYIKLSGDNTFERQYYLAKEYYLHNFILSNGIPKYYNNKTYPIDSTSAAQTIITLIQIGRTEIAEKVAMWMCTNMQSPSGYFYYQKKRFFSNKISYMRWSNSWMYVALSNILAIYEE